MVDGLVELRQLGPGAGCVLDEDPVAPGGGELVNLEIGALVGRRHPGVAKGRVHEKRCSRTR